MENQEREIKMEIKHCWSGHELDLCMMDKDGGVQLSCRVCEQPISSGLLYACGKCGYYLHKSCAELPYEIFHPSHHCNLPITHRPWGKADCNVCGDEVYTYSYSCNYCGFAVDIKCAMKVMNTKMIKHINHQHDLMRLKGPTTFCCDACGREHKSETSYMCPTCTFWLGQKCASLPTTFKCCRHPDHDHDLSLITHSMLEVNGYERLSCSICGDAVNKIYWFYFCSHCRYTVHLHCVDSNTQKYSIDYETQIELEGLDRDQINNNSALLGITTPNAQQIKNVMKLPSDKAIDLLVTELINKSKNMSMQDNHNKTLNHDSHDHALTFFNSLIDDDFDEKCNGCAQSILAPPFYQCASDQHQCNFFLHEYCTKLPNEVQHPYHPQHPLLLNKKIEQYRCGICNLFHNAFSFVCHRCEFLLDIKCASLPSIVKHDSHKHILTLRRFDFYQRRCNSCEYFIRFGFTCDGCKYNLCIRCILLPPTVVHRYDEHEFTLTYYDQASVIKDEEDYCLICEEEIILKPLFYHCGPCDRSLHTECVLPIDEDLNFKYGDTIQIAAYHEHSVRVVQIPKDNSECHICGKPFRRYHNMTFECEPCKFWIHRHCIRPIYKINVEWIRI